MKCWLFVVFVLINGGNACETHNLLTCKLDDSIIITDASNCSLDESITFDGVVYPKGTYGTLYGEDFVLRGCICQIKICARLCCPYGQILDGTNCIPYEAASNVTIEVEVKVKDQIQTIILNENQNYALLTQNGPCAKHFSTNRHFLFSKVIF